MNLDTNLRNTKRRKVPFWMYPWKWTRDAEVCVLTQWWFNPFLDQNLSRLLGGNRTWKHDTQDIFLRTLSCPLPFLWLTALFCFPPALMWAAIPHSTRHNGQKHLRTTEESESFCKLLAQASWSHWQKWKPLSLSTVPSALHHLLAHHSFGSLLKKGQINDWKLKICSWPLNTNQYVIATQSWSSSLQQLCTKDFTKI